MDFRGTAVAVYYYLMGWRKIICDLLLIFFLSDEFLSPALEAYESSTDENCLFSSVSAVLYGNEGFTHRLRLATVYEGIINSESYSKKVGYLLLGSFTFKF